VQEDEERAVAADVDSSHIAVLDRGAFSRMGVIRGDGAHCWGGSLTTTTLKSSMPWTFL